MPNELTVALVEDDDGLRQELAKLINAAQGLRCGQIYSDAEKALAGIPSDQPDIVVMDINLPGMSGIECVRQLKTLLPDLPIVMLTVYEDSDALFQSLVAGANGYLLKRTPRPQLIAALREICAGGAPMSRSMARKVVDFFHQLEHLPVPQAGGGEVSKLTVRERDVLASLAKGYSYKEIAGALHIGNDTVRNHMRNIYEKLHVHSRTEAVLKYLGQPGRRNT